MSKTEFYPLDTSGEGIPTPEQFEKRMDAARMRTKEAQASLNKFAIKLIRGKRPRKPRKERLQRPGEVLGGRPYLVADMPAMLSPGDKWVFDDIVWEYNRIVRTLTYRESRAICNAFDYTYSTFKARRSLYRPAPLWEVLLVVDWYKRGKPIVRKRHTHTMMIWEWREQIEAAIKKRQGDEV